MSFSTFKDFSKCVDDIFNDDFDYKYLLKVKTNAPHGVSLTTATEYASKGGKSSLGGKITGKWASSSGFAVDKLEVKGDGSIVTETSLVGVAPGLKFEFKGDDSSKGDLGLIYKHAHATATAELDVVEFSKIKASVHGGHNAITAGVSSVIKLGDKPDVTDFDVCASYTAPKQFFAGFTTAKKFTDFGASINYLGCPKYEFGGKFNFQPEKSTTTATLGAVYKCCPSTTLKAKVNNDAVVSLSVKHACPEYKATAVAAFEADARDLSQFKVGLTYTIG